MNIDRHNYEEYFILYWDNELPDDQRRLVEHFVNQNPDLQEEFNLLGQSHFTPDENLCLENKEFLYKEDITSTRELLLSYMDNELAEPEKSAVEAYISIDPNVRHEFALLQKTRLRPDKTIVFPDKSILYRKEKVPVLKMVWFRVAAAAVIILVAGLVTIRISNPPPVAEKAAFVQTGLTVFINGSETISDSGSKDQPGMKQVDQDVPLIVVNKKDNTGPGNKIAFQPVKSKKANNEKQENSSALLVDNNVQGNKPSQLNKIPNESVAIVKSKSENANIINSTVTSKSTPSLDIQDSSNYGHYASNNEDPSNNKGGIRGLLRKATRVFERRTNIPATTEDNKLLVGAFAVSLK